MIIVVYLQNQRFPLGAEPASFGKKNGSDTKGFFKSPLSCLGAELTFPPPRQSAPGERGFIPIVSAQVGRFFFPLPPLPRSAQGGELPWGLGAAMSHLLHCKCPASCGKAGAWSPGLLRIHMALSYGRRARLGMCLSPETCNLCSAFVLSLLH